MVGKQYSFSDSYSIEPGRVSYDEITDILKQYSLVSKETEDGKIQYLLPGNIVVTAFIGSSRERDTILWISGGSKKIPKSLKRLLNVARAECFSSCSGALEDRVRVLEEELDSEQRQRLGKYYNPPLMEKLKTYIFGGRKKE